MTRPEEALERARAAAGAIRARDPDADLPHTESGTPPPLTREKLAEWALIDPDLRDVRSTRRFGAPMTAIKRSLLRLLEQYHVELRSQQTRFNVGVLAQLRALELRIAELERRAEDRPPAP